MRQAIENRLHELMTEIDNLNTEKQALSQRQDQIEVRMHQLVGAIYELQQLIADLDHQPLAQVVSEEQAHLSTHPSEGADLNIHQGLPEETEKNSPQQS